MHKSRKFAWLPLLVVALFIIISGSLFGLKNLERAEGITGAKDTLAEKESIDPYEALIISEEQSIARLSQDLIFNKGLASDFEGESLSIRKEQNEKLTPVERKWDIPFVSLELMSHLLDYEMSWTVKDEEMVILKNTEEGQIRAVIASGKREILVEFEDEHIYQKDVLLTAEPYFSQANHLMVPLKDLLQITGYDIAFAGGDMVEIGAPMEDSVKYHLLGFIEDNGKMELEGYFEKLSQSQEKKEINLILLGDMGLGTGFGRKNPFDEKWQKYGGAHFLTYLKEDFDAADMVITNLENVFTERTAHQPGKIYTYKAHNIDYLDVLSEGGITHVNVVNNHMVDYLQEGFDDTLDHLDEYGIEYFGTNLSRTENIEIGNVKVDKYTVFEKDGFRIGMLGYLGFNSSFVSDEKIEKDIRMMKETEKVDYIIAAMHWGGQDTHEVSWKQRSMGQKLIDMGVDLVYGNHPHVLQEVEIYNGKPIYYSLGNFLFIDYKGAKDPDGMMVKVRLTKDTDGEIQALFAHNPILWSGDKALNTYMPRHMDDADMRKRALDKLKIDTSEPMEFR